MRRRYGSPLALRLLRASCGGRPSLRSACAPLRSRSPRPSPSRAWQPHAPHPTRKAVRPRPNYASEREVQGSLRFPPCASLSLAQHSAVASSLRGGERCASRPLCPPPLRSSHFLWRGLRSSAPSVPPVGRLYGGLPALSPASRPLSLGRLSACPPPPPRVNDTPPYTMYINRTSTEHQPRGERQRACPLCVPALRSLNPRSVYSPMWRRRREYWLK